MKTRCPKLDRLVAVVYLAGWVVGLQAGALPLAQLGIQTYAGLSITGRVGAVFSVEYLSDLAQTNNQSTWHCLEFLQLPAKRYLWVDRSAPVTGKRFYRAVVFPAPTNMVFIPPGTFRMGSPTTEVGRALLEGPQTDVIISRGFWMGKYEVTQGEYLAVMGDNSSWFNGKHGGEGGVDFGNDLTRPVEQASWYDATNYCGQLTERERAAGRIPSNCVYRLPTEAEWEYACRAGTSTRFSYGDDPGYTNLAKYAWYNGNSGETTHPVGQKLPNAWGLYDIHGNVREWCQDWSGINLPGGLVLDPQGPASGSLRMLRGGWFLSFAMSCRSASRTPRVPVDKSLDTGFRIILAPGQP